ncbi:hypothetical protein BG842_12390 [Haladaptatus sp. W1]|nr:hypothetical protein BG842_12390 [Haladaptatus sp. W1]
MSLTKSPSRTTVHSFIATVVTISVSFWFMTPTRGVSRIVTVALAAITGSLSFLFVTWLRSR